MSTSLSLSPERTRTLEIGAAGLVGTVALWWLVAATVLARFQVPTPGEVLATFADRGFDYYRTVFSITLEESLYGYLVGVALALTVAVLVLLVPFIEPIVMQLAVITYCLPIVVLAPILITVHEIPEKGGLSATAIDLAAVSVFFTTVVGAVLGFRAADQATLDVVEVYGGSRLQQLLRVRVVAALPALFTTLQIAAPAAFLGALLGEYFDRHLEIGVGPSLILSQNNRETALAWSLGIGCALVSGLAYALLGLLGRVVAPWSRGAAS
ncbi:MAG: ABC transporter permease subunit [Propionibacteriales bacterium]|nr:ABC transporter permease subunit [Propionibacteriales bacterium]